MNEAGSIPALFRLGLACRFPVRSPFPVRLRSDLTCFNRAPTQPESC
jgi:hypothetical protein